MSEYWMVIGVTAGLLVFLLLVLVYIRSRRRPTLKRALASVAVDRLEDIVVPDGMGGEIYIEQLLLTSRGLIVLDVKRYQGAIFAGDRMDEWTVITANRRYTFPNPQGTLYDRVAALRQFVRDVPVNGHVLFMHGADFSKGRPRDVILPDELEGLYGRPDRSEAQRLLEAFAQHWDHVRDAAKPAGHTGAGVRL